MLYRACCDVNHHHHLTDLRWEWVREVRDTSRFEAKKVDTSENVADILTKCLGGATSSALIECVRQRAKAVAAGA